MTVTATAGAVAVGAAAGEQQQWQPTAAGIGCGVGIEVRMGSAGWEWVRGWVGVGSEWGAGMEARTKAGWREQGQKRGWRPWCERQREQ